MRVRLMPYSITVAVLAAALATGGLTLMTRLRAQTQIDLDAGDAMRNAVAQQVGQRVRLRLVSGQELDGQVVRVGLNAVALTQLAGMELFDATVRLDQVAAVIIRRAK